MFFRHRKKTLDFQEYAPESELVAPRTERVMPEIPVIDAHTHLGPRYPNEDFERRYDMDALVDKMKAAGVVHAVDLELFSEKVFNTVLKRAEDYSEYFSYCMPVELQGFEEPDFSRVTQERLHRMGSKPQICGIKIWKELGLELRRRNGTYARIDDPEFEVIWNFAKAEKLPVVMHVADPTAFFKKPDRHNERLKELLTYPMWSYYGKKMPGHSDLLGQMQTLMKRHRDVTFVIAHVGSLANDLDRVEQMMDANSNMYVDIAAVLAELGRQPLRFHAFAEKLQDRILFGTDMFGGDPLCYEQYYRFLGTRDEFFPYHPEGRCTQGDWRIYGTGLSETVLRKIYYSNAEKVYIKRAHK